MFESLLFYSSWLTAALLMSVAWFVYNYSLNVAAKENYWNNISAGVLFLAASELIRPLFMLSESILWVYWILSTLGGIMIAYGFYRLYEEERV